jgi:plastocyanin
MLNGLSLSRGDQRGSVSLDLPLVVAVVFGLGFVGAMVGMMAWWGGGHGTGEDQTPVVAETEQVTVEMRDFRFVPADLTVNAGTEVTWLNRDAVPHDAVADDGAFDTGRLDRGESASVVLEEPGSYHYACSYHPDMAGVVTVR